MKVEGNVCLHVSKADTGDGLQGVLTYTSALGEEYYRSDPFPLTPGNVACFGPVCAECDLSAVFSYEPESHAEPHAEADHQEHKEQPKQPEPVKAQVGSVGQPKTRR